MAQDLVLLASLRFQTVAAFRRPRVAILPTGSELTADIGDRRKREGGGVAQPPPRARWSRRPEAPRRPSLSPRTRSAPSLAPLRER